MCKLKRDIYWTYKPYARHLLSVVNSVVWSLEEFCDLPFYRKGTNTYENHCVAEFLYVISCNPHMLTLEVGIIIPIF